MNDQALSEAIEALLVSHNPRNMRSARAALKPGYYLRAAKHLRDINGVVLIGTGFPIKDTFETDGPVGAIALYQCLERLGARPQIFCGPPLSAALSTEFNVLELRATDLAAAEREARKALRQLKPVAVVSIERPGLAADGRYYNMRGLDITNNCFYFDPFLSFADCPTIGVGDGGNEIGMGNIAAALKGLEIQASTTCCDELLVADVSNWGAYGLLVFLGRWAGHDFLADIKPEELLLRLVERGSLDGITGEKTLTEDGMAIAVGNDIIQRLRALADTQ